MSRDTPKEVGGYTRSMWMQMLEDGVVADPPLEVFAFIKEEFPEYVNPTSIGEPSTLFMGQEIPNMPIVDTYPKYQVCWGMKSHHHHTFESISFHPSFFDKKEDAVDWLRKSKSMSCSLVTYFILDVY
jgi:hypothetical protein